MITVVSNRKKVNNEITYSPKIKVGMCATVSIVKTLMNFFAANNCLVVFHLPCFPLLAFHVVLNSSLSTTLPDCTANCCRLDRWCPKMAAGGLYVCQSYTSYIYMNVQPRVDLFF